MIFVWPFSIMVSLPVAAFRVFEALRRLLFYLGAFFGVCQARLRDEGDRRVTGAEQVVVARSPIEKDRS
jgi:hypothetical protein